MAEVRPEDIEEAFRRWRDFVALQPYNEEAMAERIESIKAGEMTAWEALNEAYAETDKGAAAERIAAFRESVDMGDDPQRAFWAEMDKELGAHPLQPIVTEELSVEQIVDALKKAANEKATMAAYMGLVIGLTARQLADERPD